jgi:tRNA modification GTPase
LTRSHVSARRLDAPAGVFVLRLIVGARRVFLGAQFAPRRRAKVSVIYALSSGAGKAGVAVVRLSGPGVGEILSTMAGGLPPPRRASLRRIRSREGHLLDHGLALWFPAPDSYTGEDCAELHLHGSRAVVAATLAALAVFEGCRPAEPGEFSRRAFLNGKVDLIDLEALADLIDSETEGQRRQALAQFGGPLRPAVEGWLDAATAAHAEIEAALDFSDEGDVDVDLSSSRFVAARLATECRAFLARSQAAEPMLHGLRVAIVGPPNAGKSSLLNALAGHEAAIVSDRPGTTRDVVEVRLDLGGMPVRLADTAGLRESGDAIEQMGVARALERARDADLVLWVAMESPPPRDGFGEGDVLCVASQRDRFGDESLPAWAQLGVSAMTGAGIELLLARIADVAQHSSIGQGDVVLRARQRRLIESAADHFARASRAAAPELSAEDFRLARSTLASVLGKAGAGDILDDVFGRFCIGK